MNKLFAVTIALFFMSISCTNNSKNTNATSSQEKLLDIGLWKMKMDLGEETLPFHFNLTTNNDSFIIEILNGEERIVSNNFIVKNDSFKIILPVFNTYFKGKVIDKKTIEGYWYNPIKGVNYKIPFMAFVENGNRFSSKADIGNVSRFTGKWDVDFSPGKEDHYKAIGIFKAFNKGIAGTFLTETGDYRFLEGNVYDDHLYLSCFDGSHAFLFKAQLNDLGELSGMFWSGVHWSESWTAKKDDNAILSHPDSLTYLREGYESFDFELPNLNGDTIKFSDSKFDNKVVIIQIMGSWCPNCVDEGVFYKELYDQYKGEGLEIIALAFEAHDELDKSIASVERYQAYTKGEYEFLIAGKASKKVANEVLPMLNHVMSFPTSLFIDRSGNIRKIHTGFYGPGTGEYYENYVLETKVFIEELLSEPVK